MAVVKTEKIGFGRDHNFTRKVKCDNSGKFSVNLPDEVKAAGYSEPEGFDSMDAALGGYHDVIEKYNTDEKVERKVIAFKWQTSSWMHSRDNEFTGSLCVNARVFIETKVGSQRPGYKVVEESKLEDTSISYNVSRSSPNHGHHIIDWTQETEDFFVDVANALTKFSEIVEGLIGEDEDGDQLEDINERILEFRSSNQLPHIT